MYDAPFATLTRIGWVLAVVVLALLAARAVRVERRVTSPARTRLLDVGLGVAVTVAVLGFVAVLVAIVWGTLVSWG